jgi:hypothetical protein
VGNLKEREISEVLGLDGRIKNGYYTDGMKRAWTGFIWFSIHKVTGFYEHSNEFSLFIKCG